MQIGAFATNHQSLSLFKQISKRVGTFGNECAQEGTTESSERRLAAEPTLRGTRMYLSLHSLSGLQLADYPEAGAQHCARQKSSAQIAGKGMHIYLGDILVHGNT